MSLINQMLQDLEQRNASAAKTEPLSGEVRAVSPASSGVQSTSLLLGLALVLLGAAATWMYLHQTARPAVQMSPVAPVAAPVDKPAAAVAETRHEQVATPPANHAAQMQHVAGLDKKLSISGQPHVAPQPQEQVTARTTADAAAASAVTTSVVTDTAAKSSVIEKQKSGSRNGSVAAGATVKTMNPSQQSDNLYRQGTLLMQQGRVAEAQEMLTRSLDSNPDNLKARQALVGLLVESKHNDEAITLLQDGLKLAPEQSGFSEALARLQVEAGDSAAGLKTLEQGLPYAGDLADYHAFYAALLQRDGRHDEAIQHYLTALKTDPAMPSWLVGIGISLQTQGKSTDAIEAFQRAKDTGQLTPQLNQFVEQRLSQLKH